METASGEKASVLPDLVGLRKENVAPVRNMTAMPNQEATSDIHFARGLQPAANMPTAEAQIPGLGRRQRPPPRLSFKEKGLFKGDYNGCVSLPNMARFICGQKIQPELSGDDVASKADEEAPLKESRHMVELQWLMKIGCATWSPLSHPAELKIALGWPIDDDGSSVTFTRISKTEVPQRFNPFRLEIFLLEQLLHRMPIPHMKEFLLWAQCYFEWLWRWAKKFIKQESILPCKSSFGEKNMWSYSV